MSSSPGRGREPREGLLDLVHEIGVVTRPDASLPPEQRLRRSMQAYFDLVERRAAEYRQIYRLEIGADPELRALVGVSLERQAERLLALLAPDVRAREMVRFAVHGWFRFLIDACLRWLDTRAVDREALCDMCVDTLFSAVASATRAGTAEDY
jgi:hypothetical protein